MLLVLTFSKLLGLMFSNRGIEVDPKKVKAIINMPPSRNLKQLRSLQGKINLVKRFISQLGDEDCLKKMLGLYGMKIAKKHLMILKIIFA